MNQSNSAILVTGGAGSIGSRLCAHLASPGDTVISLYKREGNRMTAKLDVTKSNALGWSASKTVSSSKAEIVAEAG